MVTTTTFHSEEYISAEKALRDQIAKKDFEGYDPVLTVLLQKELNRLIRKERRASAKSEKPGNKKNDRVL
jgi:hypothetical protein